MAVYTRITEEELAQHLSKFDIGGAQSCDGISDGVENTNYRLTTPQGRFILTLLEKRAKTGSLPFCFSFMERLRERNVPCPAVVTDRAGEKTVPLCGKASVITSFLEGDWPRQVTPLHAAAAGRLLAQMHRAGTDFPQRQENAMSLPAWKSLISSCGDKADKIAPGLSGLLKRELEFLSEEWPRQLPEGAVHADFFPDNVFFKGNEVSGVIDFYFSCTDAFAYDLMLALNAWCFAEEGVAEAQKISAFLGAYEQQRPLSAEEKAALPFLGRAASMRIISTRLYDWLHPASGAVVRPKDPRPYIGILNFYREGKWPA